MGLVDAFRRNLRRERERQGLTQLDVAQRLGVSESVISRLETGRRSVSLTVVEQVATALGVTPLMLLAEGSHRRRSRPPWPRRPC